MALRDALPGRQSAFSESKPIVSARDRVQILKKRGRGYSPTTDRGGGASGGPAIDRPPTRSADRSFPKEPRKSQGFRHFGTRPRSSARPPQAPDPRFAAGFQPVRRTVRVIRSRPDSRSPSAGHCTLDLFAPHRAAIGLKIEATKSRQRCDMCRSVIYVVASLFSICRFRRGLYQRQRNY